MKNNSHSAKDGRILTSILKRMLLILLFLANLAPTIQAEEVERQQNTGISINVSNVSLKNLFNILEQKSNYIFFYSNDAISGTKNTSIRTENEAITSILDKVLPPKQLTYTIKGRQIIVSRVKDVEKTVVPVAAPKNFRLKGKVVDAARQPLPGANVVVNGQGGAAAITDLDGNFTLDIEGRDKVQLSISYIGFQTKSISTGETVKPLFVVLEENAAALSEVVVVGYGTQKKLNLTGAVATASGDILSDRPIGNIAQGLQGVIPNLNITFDSGQPNQTAKINIRGNTSLNGGSALILVDGVEISDLSLLNPQDIESVSVLKDASSAAIYGARAAFGVMLVTTKKGSKNQKLRINYNDNFSWNTPARLPEAPRSDVWCRAINQMFDYASPGSYMFNDKFMKALDAHIADPANNPAIIVDTEGIQNSNYTPNNPGWAYVGNTDWLGEFYKKAAFMQQHNLSISGGTERNSYYGSVGYKDQSGIFRHGNDQYERLNFSFNFDTKITDWLDLGFSTKYNDMKSDEPYKDNLGSDAVTWFYEVYRMFPTLSVYLPNGDFAGLSLRSGNYNVIGQMDLAGRNKKTTNDLWYSGKFDIHPLPGLSIKGDYSINKYFTTQKIHKKTLYQTMPEGVDPIPTEVPNSVKNYRSNNTYQAINVWAEYKKTFNKDHNMGLMVGYNQEGKDYSSTDYTMTDLFDNELPMSDLAINYKTNNETATCWRVQGAFFRANYDYKSKYLVEVNGRFDGSSKFPKDKRWTFVPSASIGWRISEEAFFKPLTKVVDNLKIRASIGALGNQAITDNFSYVASLTGKTLTNYMMGGSMISGLRAPTLPSIVTWEKVLSKNIGLDWGLFGNRLNGSFDFYVRNTKDMIRPVTLPAVLGTDTGKENVADMKTTGWELEIGWKDKIQNVWNSPFEYSLSIGLSDYHAEITKYDNPNGSLASGMYYEGQKIGEIRGYVTEGFIKDDNEAAEMNYVQKFISSKWYPGEIRYRDLNGDGIINTGNLTLNDPGDQKVIGNSTPRYRFNIQGGITWQNFDLRFMFEGVGKRDLWTGSDQFWGFSRGVYNSNITQYHIDNTWTYENPTAFFPRPADNKKSKQVQSKYLSNAAYIRLKDVTLSYSIPKRFLSKIHMDQVRVYASGMNLWEATGLLPFMTPDIVDQITEGGSALQSENAGKQYAFMRSFSCGINITF